LIGGKTITNYDLSNESGAGSLEMGRKGDGEKGRWGEREMGRWGDGEMGRLSDKVIGVFATLRLCEREKG